MTIVETTVWVDYFNRLQTPQTEWLDRNLRETEIGLYDLILCEVLQGMNQEAEFQETQKELQRFDVLPTGGAELAIASAKNFQRLRRKGLTVRKTVDCLIATACIRDGYQLLHNDRDYLPFELHLGLQVVPA